MYYIFSARKCTAKVSCRLWPIHSFAFRVSFGWWPVFPFTFGSFGSILLRQVAFLWLVTSPFRFRPWLTKPYYWYFCFRPHMMSFTFVFLLIFFALPRTVTSTITLTFAMWLTETLKPNSYRWAYLLRLSTFYFIKTVFFPWPISTVWVSFSFLLRFWPVRCCFRVFEVFPGFLWVLSCWSRTTS